MFSIICPVYNSSSYLNECIESVLNQTFKDFQLVLIDDGSTDNSYTICKEYEQSDKRIKVLSQQNSGPCSARINGIHSSSGDYLLFLDSDDKLIPQCLETLNSIIQNTYFDIIAFNFCVDKSGSHSHKEEFVEQKIIEGTDNILIESFCKRNLGNLCRFCVKRDRIDFLLLEKSRDFRYAEDAYMIFSILSNSTSMVILKDRLYYYRSVSGSLTNSTNQNDKYGRFVIYSAIVNDLFEKGLLLRLGEDTFARYSWIPVSYLLHSYKDKHRVFLNRLSTIRHSLIFNEITIKSKIDNKKAKIVIFLAKNNFKITLRIFTKIFSYYH